MFSSINVFWYKKHQRVRVDTRMWTTTKVGKSLPFLSGFSALAHSNPNVTINVRLNWTGPITFISPQNIYKMCRIKYRVVHIATAVSSSCGVLELSSVKTESMERFCKMRSYVISSTGTIRLHRRTIIWQIGIRKCMHDNDNDNDSNRKCQ